MEGFEQRSDVNALYFNSAQNRQSSCSRETFILVEEADNNKI